MLPDLPEVTLVAVSSVALEPTLEALETSTGHARFARALLLSDRSPPRMADTRIEWRRIRPIRTRSDYSRFMLRELADYVETSHALCIQWDGFVLNGNRWDSRFLEYDYVGAVWPHFGDAHTVGNGGFSLRSKRLLEACRDLPFDGSQQEDVVISRTSRGALESRGMTFAPEEVALQFSYERTPPTGNEFGFHGIFNLVRLLAPAKASRLLRSLEPNLLARSEQLELLRWAARNGHMQLALAMMSRLLRRPRGSERS